MYDWALLRYASLFSSGLLLHPPARRRPGIKRARKIPVKRFISPPYHLLPGKYHISEQRERNMLRRSAHATGWAVRLSALQESRKKRPFLDFFRPRYYLSD
jgi:hypothetical protein